MDKPVADWVLKPRPEHPPFSGVTRGGEWGRTAPGNTIQRGWHPNEKKIVAEFTKNTGLNDVGRWELWSCDERRLLKKGHHFVAMTILRGKIGVTPSVAAPGDTHSSDATAFIRSAQSLCMNHTA